MRSLGIYFRVVTLSCRCDFLSVVVRLKKFPLFLSIFGAIMRVFQAVLVSLSAASVFAASATTTAERTSVTGCHSHGSDIFCIKEDGEEVQVSATATPTTGIPAQYTGCHYHGTELYVLFVELLTRAHSNLGFLADTARTPTETVLTSRKKPQRTSTIIPARNLLVEESKIVIFMQAWSMSLSVPRSPMVANCLYPDTV